VTYFTEKPDLLKQRQILLNNARAEFIYGAESEVNQSCVNIHKKTAFDQGGYIW
jgi:hypothetical protein